MKHQWLKDVLRPIDTRLREDVARTASLGYNHDGIDAFVLADPLVAQTGDILLLSRRRSLIARLLRRGTPQRPRELVVVHLAGGTFTFVRRQYGGTLAADWRKGDRVTVIGVVSR